MADEQEFEVVMEALREKLKKCGAQGIRGLARNFKICDRDGSRSLDVQELAKCCSMCKLGLSPDEVRTLHGFFDRGGDGYISFDEFLKAIRGKLSPSRRKLVTKVCTVPAGLPVSRTPTSPPFHPLLRPVTSRSHDGPTLVPQAFNALDASGDQNGYLTIEDLQHAYSANMHPDVKAGRRTEKEVLLDLLEVFEGSGGGTPARPRGPRSQQQSMQPAVPPAHPGPPSGSDPCSLFPCALAPSMPQRGCGGAAYGR